MRSSARFCKLDPGAIMAEGVPAARARSPAVLYSVLPRLTDSAMNTRSSIGWS